MTGSFWWELVIGVAGALLLAWLALVITLIVVRPKGPLLRESLRLLPDVLRLIRRLPQIRTSLAGSGSGSGSCWDTWPCRSI